MPKNLEEIWYDLRPGNIVAYQTLDGWDGSRYTEVDKIRIGTVVAIDIFDMALAVGVVDLCKFDCFGIRHTKEKLPEIEWLIEWGTTNYVVGFWTRVPSVSEAPFLPGLKTRASCRFFRDQGGKGLWEE